MPGVVVAIRVAMKTTLRVCRLASIADVFSMSVMFSLGFRGMSGRIEAFEVICITEGSNRFNVCAEFEMGDVSDI